LLTDAHASVTNRGHHVSVAVVKGVGFQFGCFDSRDSVAPNTNVIDAPAQRKPTTTVKYSTSRIVNRNLGRALQLVYFLNLTPPVSSAIGNLAVVPGPV